MSHITTHVLDLDTGLPADGLAVNLDQSGEREEDWHRIGRGITDVDGRIRDLLPAASRLEPGIYRLVFETGAYFERRATENFYPRIPVVFRIRDAQRHYHVPLLLSPFGYSTYRGS